ncbi:hypothetical protein PG989_014033 [Apiospora arundinis]
MTAVPITLTRGEKVLVDCKSETATCIGQILNTLEIPDFITIVLDKAKSELEVGLPRYDLSFTLKQGTSDLRCRKYPGMRVDGDQSIGSLVGLKSKLVLCPRNHETSRRKSIIIPYGTPQVIGDSSYHATDVIPTESKGTNEYGQEITRCTYLYYEKDELLGRLIDNGSLQSKLLLCHLHAATSYCLADPLTGRTGIEEALRILKSAAVVSFSRLDLMEAEQLFNIARLSPVRNFYPGGDLMVTQKVAWSKTLHSLAQNDEFRQVAKAILQQATSSEIYFHPAQEFRMPQESNAQLVSRALIRQSAFRVDGFGAEYFTSTEDRFYQNRDIVQGSLMEGPEQKLCHVTEMLLSQHAFLVEPLPDASNLMGRIYSVLGNEVLDSSHPSDIPFDGFDIQWLNEPTQIIGPNWRGLHRYLATVNASNSRFSLMTFFGGLIFAPEADFAVIQLLLALVYCPNARSQHHPQHRTFRLGDGHGYDRNQILQCLDEKARAPQESPEWKMKKDPSVSKSTFYKRRKSAWKAKLEVVKQKFQAELQARFPHEPNVPTLREVDVYINVEGAMGVIRELFRSWARNQLFHDYLIHVVDAVAGLPLSPPQVSATCSFSCHVIPVESSAAHVKASDVFSEKAPEVICRSPFDRDDLLLRSAWPDNEDGHDNSSLQTSGSLIESLQSMAKDTYELEYIQELKDGFESYREIESDESLKRLTLDPETVWERLHDYLDLCKQEVKLNYKAIYQSFFRQANRLIPHSKHFFPRLSPVFILQRLNKNYWPNLPDKWRRCIITYARSLTHLQRAERMMGLADNKLGLLKEVDNVGHSWELDMFPDSLLMEVESGLMIRDVQEKVAASMRSSDGNRVMQLNMGEGKSSVIVQIVAAHLADGEWLVRVIVAKAQSKQMRHMLVTKLGGLLDRQVFFLPFSRTTKMDETRIAHLQGQLERCKKEGGILLVQPEELLSFKLMGLERVGAIKPLAQKEDQGSDTMTTGYQLMESQKYLDTFSRDIIDESDENFSVKFEMVYTIGTQRPTEMSPDRWLIIQNVLTLVARFAPDVKKSHPDGIQLQAAEIGQFALLRFHSDNSGTTLLETVAHHIRDNGCHCLPMSHQSQSTRDLIHTYITQLDVDKDVAKHVEDTSNGFFNDVTRNVLLLLRGLFAHGVLSFAFGQKRWRVDYGLTTRTPPTMLAVPYRAKDSPAPRSEFSHPDVVIVLTCLSYYYGGLSDAEMDMAFEQLERSDQSSNIYNEWAADTPSLEPAFQQLSSVNRKDRSQCLGQIFPAMRRTKAVVDFYLSKVVFPKECMEFPTKLSASGWDLAKPRPQVVTGFSGTCDSKYVLPTDVSHLDLASQSHTNAAVLGNLLRQENTVKHLEPDFNSEDLLKAAVNSELPVQVILDVGALIVDLDNDEVARKWLEMTPNSDKEAVIFLNREDDMLVMDRNGSVEPFLTSSFVENTDACFVFLDEAHTRGIDLRLPDHYRAATTLGPKLTKDRLVQACMRMRKLGKGQSVIFFVPNEIQKKINAVRPLHNAPVQVCDVLCWSIAETWADTRRSVALWAQQGLRHQRQEAIWEREIKLSTVNDISSVDGDIIEGYFEEEGMSLKQRYSPSIKEAGNVLLEQLGDPGLSGRSAQIGCIQAKCTQLGVTNFVASSLQEEQERELACQIEEERNVQNPGTVQPLKHGMHDKIERMIAEGDLKIPQTPREAIDHAFYSVRGNSGVSLSVLDGFGQNLVVTSDFSKAVKLDDSSSPDAFQRPVQWVLTFRKSPSSHTKMVIISPFEANELLPSIEKSPHVFLHMYLPRSTHAMPRLDHLKLYVIPSLPNEWEGPRDLILKLNLFAGQMYFENFEEYKKVCAYLGLSTSANEGDAATTVDGFVGKRQYPDCQFTESPTAFLNYLMANVRRNRQDISRTHFGRMLMGEILTEADFKN